MSWRVGQKLGRTLYKDEVFIGNVDTKELAAEIVAAMNAGHNASQYERLANRYLAERNDQRDRAATAMRSLRRARDTARRAKQLWEEGKESQAGGILDSVLRELENAVRAIDPDGPKSAPSLPDPEETEETKP